MTHFGRLNPEERIVSRSAFVPTWPAMRFVASLRSNA
jgi:hypothetical protein